MMKPAELRELNENELKLKLSELQELMFRYRFQTSMGQLDNPIKIRSTRRDIARIKTIIHEKLSASKKTEAKSSD